MFVLTGRSAVWGRVPGRARLHGGGGGAERGIRE